MEAETSLPIRVITRTLSEDPPRHEYDVYINEITDDLNDYCEFVDILRHADEDDSIKIYINSSGGNFYTLVQILHAIEECRCHITTIADGLVASSASIIFFSVKDKEIGKYSKFLFHAYETELNGVGAHVKDNCVEQIELSRQIYSRYYSNVLTKGEINRLTAGGAPIILLAEKVKERLKKYGNLV